MAEEDVISFLKKDKDKKKKYTTKEISEGIDIGLSSVNTTCLHLRRSGLIKYEELLTKRKTIKYLYWTE